MRQASSASLSRQGRKTIAHRFSGGTNDRWPAQSRQGRKTAQTLVCEGAWNSMADRQSKPLSSLPGLRIVGGDALPPAEAVGYFRVSLPGQRDGRGQMGHEPLHARPGCERRPLQVSGVNSCLPLTFATALTPASNLETP